MRCAGPLALVLLAGCPSSSPPDGGCCSHSGPSGADAGGADAGVIDAGVALPCNTLLHLVTDPVRDGGTAGALVLGLSNPTESMTVGPGGDLTLPIYLFNQATLTVVGGDGGIAQIFAPVYAMDQSTFRIQSANVDVTTGSPFFFGDESTFDVADSGFALGPLLYNLQLEESCGGAHAAIRNSDFTVRRTSSASVFVRDLSTFVVSGNRGLIEATLDEGGHLDVSDTTDPAGVVGVYFQIRQPAPMTLTLASTQAMAGPPQVVQLAPDPQGFSQSASVADSNVFYGIWLDPGTNLTLANSALGLFLNYHGNGSASGIAATPGNGPPETRTFPLNDRTLNLQSTRIQVLNVYQGANATPGTLTLDSVTIGEHSCNGVAGTQCIITNSTIDGSGGFVSVGGNATLTVKGSVLETYLEADGQAVVRLQRGLMSAGAAKPQIWIQASGAALVSLEDEFLGLPDGGGLPTFTTQQDAAISTCVLDLPFTPTAVTRGAPYTVAGTAQIQSRPGGPLAFEAYRVTLSQGGSVVTSSQGAQQVDGGPLAMLSTAPLDAGSYTLDLILFADGGVVADITRPIQLQ